MIGKSQVAVIGSGIIGLSSALTLLNKGLSVAVYSSSLIHQTSSSIAHAYWWPHKIKFDDRIEKWASSSYQMYSKFSDISESGVSIKKYLRFCFDQDESLIVLKLFNDWKEIDGKEYGISSKQSFSMMLPSIDTFKHLNFLKSEIFKKGGTFIERQIKSFDNLINDHSFIVNCSGLGAKELASDSSVFPIRGQTVRISTDSKIKDYTPIYKSSSSFSTITPFGSDLILAGVAQEGDSYLSPRKEDTGDIIARCKAFDSTLTNINVIEERVGLRPGRPSIRLEKEDINGRSIIHNYGHGGSGYSLPWGCAEDVASLIL